jgi:hypothetical protein
VRSARQEGHFNDDEWHASLERIDRVRTQAEAPGPQPSMSTLGCKENQRLAEEIRARLRQIRG